jgi:hypothetical protein
VGTAELSAQPNQDWQKYFWAANLQHSVERSLIALHLCGPDAHRPIDIQVNVRLLMHLFSRFCSPSACFCLLLFVS